MSMNSQEPGYEGAEDLGEAEAWLKADPTRAFASNRFSTQGLEMQFVRKLKAIPHTTVRVVQGGLKVKVPHRYLVKFIETIGDARADEIRAVGKDTYTLWWD